MVTLNGTDSAETVERGTGADTIKLYVAASMPFGGRSAVIRVSELLTTVSVVPPRVTVGTAVPKWIPSINNCVPPMSVSARRICGRGSCGICALATTTCMTSEATISVTVQPNRVHFMASPPLTGSPDDRVAGL